MDQPLALGMPDREYYLEGTLDQGVLGAYIELMSGVVSQMGVNSDLVSEELIHLIDLEINLANVSKICFTNV